MKNDYIKQALVLEIERFKIFLTLSAVSSGSLVTILQNQNTSYNQLLSIFNVLVLFVFIGFSIKTHYDIEDLMGKLK